ncbi:MAG TPA: VOC family protein [Luteimonas sp.]
MKIVTSLSFRGQCREAFEFYARVLGGQLTAAIPYSSMPAGGMPLDERHRDWLMHAWLEVGDEALMGADMDVDWAPGIDKPKNGFDVTLHTGDPDEARRWFEQLLRRDGRSGGQQEKREDRRFHRAIVMAFRPRDATGGVPPPTLPGCPGQACQ